MRKQDIKQFLELIKTLDTACRELKKQRDADFVNLCAEIQDFVSGMFEYAETKLGEDTKIAEILKTLYELLYAVSQGNTSVKQILKVVHDLKIEAGKLKANKIEAVFFCYKASMSDSLESVYFAAKKDPSCDAYFVPIPYFDRNPDGSFGQMHLERTGCYSDQYELTDWKNYDVEARRPDVIFIMNPYDDQNLVTSVHPDFYSSRLKNCTDMLVYIEYGLPYWVYRDPCAEDIQEAMKKSIFLPVQLNAHYDIRYSKKLVEAHKPMFAAHPELVRQYHMTPERIQDKFVALGSPKFDKVLSIDRDHYLLPEDWIQKMKGKTVILYNTSLSELLKSTAQQEEFVGEYPPQDSWYFGKLRSILKAFENRQDAVLWWRPHPLSEATLHSMRPALFAEYQSLICDFKIQDKGIFDDTEELYRAIAWSDGMISDESSLLLLYMAIGKPFYIPSITKALPRPVCEDGTDFHAPLAGRLENMRASRGANVGNWNCCIWWDNFLEEDVLRNIHFNDYEDRFIDFVAHPDQYTQAEEYRRLQLQMIQDFVVNADGSAGQKIYDCMKEKALK